MLLLKKPLVYSLLKAYEDSQLNHIWIMQCKFNAIPSFHGKYLSDIYLSVSRNFFLWA